MLSIGEKIAGVRVTRELTIAEVSKKTGISESTLSRYENGIIEKIPYHNLQKIVAVLDTTVEYLAGEDMKGTQAERSELFGCLVDVVEDWLEEKGITTEDIPNEERNVDNSAIICGSDYEHLCDSFSFVLGIARNVDEDKTNETMEEKLSKEELELISTCILELMDAANRIPTLMDAKLLEAKENLRNRLVQLNHKICGMIPD